MWRDRNDAYGWVSIALHWLVAATVVFLFALGLWMHDLPYDHPWYHRAPRLHVAVGVLLWFVVLLRVAWRVYNRWPAFEPGVRPWERRLARVVHYVLYALLLAVPFAGYLIATADGAPVSVFGWFEIPAILPRDSERADVAGEWHEIGAWVLILLAAVHAAAALKHHFLDRDDTLRRMLRPPR